MKHPLRSAFLTALALAFALGILALVGTTHAQTYAAKRLNEGQPLITAQTFLDAGLSDRESRNINGPSVIRVPDWVAPEDRADPAAAYYMYFGHHGGKYIRMAWAEDLTGPWRLFNADPATPLVERGVLGFADGQENTTDVGNGIRIKDHMASPRVLADHENQRFALFFHAPSGVERGDGTYGSNLQRTLVALSDDGLDFRGGIQPVRVGGDYLDPFQYQGQFYGFSNTGYLYKAPEGAGLANGGLWTPPPGHNFKDDLWQRRNGPIREDHEADPDEIAKNPRHFSHRVVGDQLHIFFHRRDDEPESILLTKINLDEGDWTEWDSSHPPELIMAPELDWEGVNYPLEPSTGGGATGVVQLRDPFIYEEEGRIYMFYCGAGEEAIGLAELVPLEPYSAITPEIMEIQGREWLALVIDKKTDAPEPFRLFQSSTLHSESWRVLPLDGIDSAREILVADLRGDGLFERERFRVKFSEDETSLFLRLTYPR